MFEKNVFTDRKDFEKVLAENKTDFIICQKGKGHYQIVGCHTIMTSEGDTTIVLELGKKNGGITMFEKEADYKLARKASKEQISKVIRAWSAREETIHDVGFQKGAEFGYNKAFVEADKNLKAVVADFNKANEWHYVKDGNPKNENDILCRISKDEVVVGYYHSAKKRYITIDGQDIYNIIAWKEIVLPEFPKESE